MQTAVPSSHNAPAAGASDDIAPLMWARLAALPFWIFCFAILLIASGFLFVNAGSQVLSATYETFPELGQTVALFMLFIAMLCFAPGALLVRYGFAMRRAVKRRMVSQVLIAFRLQARYWRFISTIVVTYIVLVVLSAIVRSVFPAIAGAFK